MWFYRSRVGTSEGVSFKNALSGVFSSLKLKYLVTNIDLFLTTGLPGAAAVGLHSPITTIILLQFWLRVFEV
ncbi:hypothetical protein CY35_13G098800 [Sphagnum magellanicum]|nr:hypothetical protein CY35_13G098800 [Sphagnum magellanicum]